MHLLLQPTTDAPSRPAARTDLAGARDKESLASKARPFRASFRKAVEQRTTSTDQSAAAKTASPSADEPRLGRAGKSASPSNDAAAIAPEGTPHPVEDGDATNGSEHGEILTGDPSQIPVDVALPVASSALPADPPAIAQVLPSTAQQPRSEVAAPVFDASDTFNLPQDRRDAGEAVRLNPGMAIHTTAADDRLAAEPVHIAEEARPAPHSTTLRPASSATSLQQEAEGSSAKPAHVQEVAASAPPLSGERMMVPRREQDGVNRAAASVSDGSQIERKPETVALRSAESALDMLKGLVRDAAAAGAPGQPVDADAVESDSAAVRRAEVVQQSVRFEQFNGRTLQVAAETSNLAEGILNVQPSGGMTMNTGGGERPLGGEGSALSGSAIAQELPDEAQPFTSRIVRGLTAMLNHRGGAMTMRLDPPELGALRVQMTIRDGVVSATFAASTGKAHGLLRQHLGLLRSALESHGLTVERLHIQNMTTAQNSQESARSDQQSGGGHDQSRGQGQPDAGHGQSRGHRDQEDATHRSGARRDGSAMLFEDMLTQEDEAP